MSENVKLLERERGYLAKVMQLDSGRWYGELHRNLTHVHGTVFIDSCLKDSREDLIAALKTLRDQIETGEIASEPEWLTLD